MNKIYDPSPRVAYLIFTTNKKGKKTLYSACGNIDEIKSFCDRNEIEYSECEDNEICENHYLERNKIWEKKD